MWNRSRANVKAKQYEIANASDILVVVSKDNAMAVKTKARGNGPGQISPSAIITTLSESELRRNHDLQQVPHHTYTT